MAHPTKQNWKNNSMSGPRYRLEKYIKQTRKEGHLTNAGVIKIFSEIRQVIEANKQKDDYPHLNLYCNLCFHNSLSGSVTGYKIIQNIFDLYVELTPRGGIEAQDHFLIAASKLFSLEQLRRELILLFEQSNIPTFIFIEKDNWLRFVGRLLDEIQDKPIKLPDGIEEKTQNLTKIEKKARAIYDRMLNKSGGDKRLMIKEVSIILADEDHGWKEFRNKFCWNICDFGDVSTVGLITCDLDSV